MNKVHDSEEPKLPSVEELLKQVGHSQNQQRAEESAFSADFANNSVSNEVQYAHLQGLISHYQHKGWWSIFLMFALTMMIASQWVVLWKVGSGQWVFNQRWLLHILLVQNLGQIIGLAYVVVTALFKKMKF